MISSNLVVLRVFDCFAIRVRNKFRDEPSELVRVKFKLGANINKTSILSGTERSEVQSKDAAPVRDPHPSTSSGR